MRKLIVILTVIALAACTTIDCPVQNLVYTRYAFKKADGSADTLNNDTLWIKTKRVDGTDTLLMNALCGTTAFDFTLQISYTQPEDVFVTLLTDTAKPRKKGMESFSMRNIFSCACDVSAIASMSRLIAILLEIEVEMVVRYVIVNS